MIGSVASDVSAAAFVLKYLSFFAEDKIFKYLLNRMLYTSVYDYLYSVLLSILLS